MFVFQERLAYQPPPVSIFTHFSSSLNLWTNRQKPLPVSFLLLFKHPHIYRNICSVAAKTSQSLHAKYVYRANREEAVCPALGDQDPSGQ